jgi:hypothetical protein
MSARLALAFHAVMELRGVERDLRAMEERLRVEPLGNLFDLEERPSEDDEGDSCSGSDHREVFDFEGNNNTD